MDIARQCGPTASLAAVMVASVSMSRVDIRRLLAIGGAPPAASGIEGFGPLMVPLDGGSVGGLVGGGASFGGGTRRGQRTPWCEGAYVLTG